MRSLNSLSISFFLFFFVGCNNNNEVIQLKKEIIKLQDKINNSYKPGFGTLMGNIQNFHSKLWFSGVNKNWKLAEFYVHEIKERFDDLEKFQSSKEEIKYISLIRPAIKKLDETIKEKDINRFKNKFSELTQTCNSCHIITKHEFIEIKNPEFTNYNIKF